MKNPIIYHSTTSKKPLVSICVQTYNHEQYITECLDSLLRQNTNFEYEILLGEDCSSDNTREICINYADKYPEKIRLFLHDRSNVIKINGNATGRFNFIYNLKNSRGKYIALCEGDDYWTDPYKLQKQVDFLEKNNDFNICFHRVFLLKNNKKEVHQIPSTFENTEFNYIELIRYHNFIATTSVLFRKPEKLIFPKWFYKIPFGDLGIYKLVSNEKKIQCLNDNMGVYRIHNTGAWSGIDQKKSVENYLEFYFNIFEALTLNEKQEAKKKIQKYLKQKSRLEYPKNKLIAILNYIRLLVKSYKYL